MKKKRVLMLGAGPLQVPAICELKKLNAYVICLDYNPAAEGFAYADKSRIISTLDVDAICEAYKEEKADVIMTSTSDAPVRIISEVSERLGICCELSYEDACAVTMKHYMRQRMQENNLPIPKFVVINDFETFKRAFCEEFHKGCIIKPADNAGSRGVKLLVGEYSDKALEEEYIECREYSRNGIILAEEIMTGQEVSVEALTINGETEVLTITDKIICEKPYFVEVGHVEPSGLSEATKEKIIQITKKVIKAMNIQNGPSHTEVMVTDEGPKIVEMAARLGGDFITSKLVPLSTGINIVRESVKLSIGRKACMEKSKDKGAAIRFIASEKDGIVARIDGIQQALEQEGICEVIMYVKSGERVRALHSSSDRIGHIIAVGEDNEEAWKRVENAYQKITVVLKD